MYKKFKKYLFIMLALILTMSDAGLIKAQASNSWSTREIMKQKEQSRIKYRKTMDKKVAIFSKQNSDRSIYSTLSNVENDISGAFKNTYNFYEQNYVINQQNRLNEFNNLLNKINNYDVNDISYDNVNNIYETSTKFWGYLPDSEYENVKKYFPVKDFSFTDAFRPFIDGLKDNTVKAKYVYGKYVVYSNENIINFNKMNVQMGRDGYKGVFQDDKDQILYGGIPIITSANLSYVNRLFSNYETESTKSAVEFSKLAKKSSNKSIDALKTYFAVEDVIDDLNYFENHSGNILEYSNGKWIPGTYHGYDKVPNKSIDNDKIILHKLDTTLKYMSIHRHKKEAKKHANKVDTKKSNKKLSNKAKKKYVKNNTRKKKASKKVSKKHAKKVAKKKNNKKPVNKTRKKRVKKNTNKKKASKKVSKKRAKKVAKKKINKKALNKIKKKSANKKVFSKTLRKKKASKKVSKKKHSRKHVAKKSRSKKHITKKSHAKKQTHKKHKK
ncbi:hypothetical protein J3U50_06960 [Lactobacillus sp. B3795]|uniref:hypothetical protein n=1 Tax=Lactobacillus sp. B3795 TaxID=2818036 RepID=UPI00265CE871|nr:hypothetical protein [Lactobacillus sp. B3795]MCX8743729.1 hypothetical protein [Lactobacillus sp. B3795]